jgi:hypothetical protein
MPWLRTELHNAPIAGPSLILSIDESSSLFKSNEDNGILLASLSYICKKRYNKSKCFHVSLEKSLQLSNLIFNISLYDTKKTPCNQSSKLSSNSNLLASISLLTQKKDVLTVKNTKIANM